MARNFLVMTFLGAVGAFKDDAYALWQMPDWQLYTLAMLGAMLVLIFCFMLSNSRA